MKATRQHLNHTCGDWVSLASENEPVSEGARK